MKNSFKKLNKKLLPALLIIIFAVGLLFYIDYVKQTNSVEPIMTKTSEELYGDSIEEEETSAHTTSLSNAMPPLPDKEVDDKVLFNVSSLKFHKLNCEWAQKCQNCVIISKKEAVKRGGKPCKSCI